MDEKKLEFLNSIQDIDWNSLLHTQGKNVPQKKSNLIAVKLSKGQKKRTKKKLKKGVHAENSAASKAVETVVFQNPDINPKLSSTGGNRKRGQRSETSEGIEIDLKKARFEVMKFGMNSMRGSEKYDAETTLAMSLGAKPEKRAYVNYKELKVTRKNEKQIQLEQELEQAKAKPKSKKTKREKNKHKKGDDGVVRLKNLKSTIQKNKKNLKQRK